MEQGQAKFSHSAFTNKLVNFFPPPFFFINLLPSCPCFTTMSNFRKKEMCGCPRDIIFRLLGIPHPNYLISITKYPHCLKSHPWDSCLYGKVFPGDASGKEPACQCRRWKRHRFDPWVGKISWRRAWQPTPVFLPGESHGQRSLVDYSPWSCKELDTTEQLTVTYLLKYTR